MNNQLLIKDYGLNPLLTEQLIKTLEAIRLNLQKEIAAKQKTIENQEEQVNMLLNILKEKNNTIKTLRYKLEECQQNAEGKRQLFNKLLNDIDRLNQDIEWYKRTYEERSLFGIILNKLRFKK